MHLTLEERNGVTGAFARTNTVRALVSAPPTERVVHQGLAGVYRQRHPLDAVARAVDRDGPARPVDVLQPQRSHFGAAQTPPAHQDDHSEIPSVHRI